MARPSAEIINQQTVGDTIWQILAAESYYVITYKEQPISIRVVNYTMQGETYKYKKMTYTNQGNADAQARILNRRFHCQDFAVMQVDFGTLE